MFAASAAGAQPPPLSIVIPARNCARALRNTLDALCGGAADPSRMEIIVVDDCSSDDTASVAARYPVQLVRLESHGGSAAARNAGARRAVGEFICFLDADCVPEAGALETLLADCLSGKDCVIGRYARESLTPRFGSRYKALIHEGLFRKSPPEISWFWTGCGAMRRSLFEQLGGFDEKMFPGVAGVEDHLLGIRVVQSGHKVHFDPNVVVAHDHPRSAWQVAKNDFTRASQLAMVSFLYEQFGDEAFATNENLWRALSLDLFLVALPAGLWFWPLPVLGFLIFLGVNAPHFRELWVDDVWLSLRFVALDTFLLGIWQLGAVLGLVRVLRMKLGSRS